ncbi:MAG TPA: ABC-2 family transporter protein [Gemmataceae bacterium]|nr:ABC-2 family transporter protein [Gemmataceae bacterium]
MKPLTTPAEPALPTPTELVDRPEDGVRAERGSPGSFLIRGLRKYTKIMRVSLIERMTYRGDFFLATILRFLPMVTTILLWHAVYEGAQEGAAQPVRLSGYSLHEMIAYLLLVHISRMFSSMPGLAAGITRDIREGTLKKYLLQPIDMIAYLLSYRAAHKVAYIVTSSLPYALLFFLCRNYFDHFPTWETLGLYVLALLLGFLVGFFFEASLGMAGFWFLEVTSFLYIVNTVNFFVSGHMFPLELLPPFWATLLRMLPFQYLAYFPAAVFLGHIKGFELVVGLFGEAAWALVFAVLSRWLYRLGLRQYSAYGG